MKTKRINLTQIICFLILGGSFSIMYFCNEFFESTSLHQNCSTPVAVAYANMISKDGHEKSIPKFKLTREERETICHLVAGEAGYEPFLGKMAVAQCVYNALLIEFDLDKVCKDYKYTLWYQEMDEDDPLEWAEICRAVDLVFKYGDTVTDENILWFYSPENMENNTSEFHENQKFVIEIGGHRFFAPWD